MWTAVNVSTSLKTQANSTFPKPKFSICGYFGGFVCICGYFGKTELSDIWVLSSPLEFLNVPLLGESRVFRGPSFRTLRGLHSEKTARQRRFQMRVYHRINDEHAIHRDTDLSFPLWLSWLQDYGLLITRTFIQGQLSSLVHFGVAHHETGGWSARRSLFLNTLGNARKEAIVRLPLFRIRITRRGSHARCQQPPK